MSLNHGNITLIYEGKAVASVKYDCKAHRNKIIANWRKWYGKRLDKCYLHITPLNVDERIKNDGTNYDNRGRYKKGGSKRKSIGINYHKLRA